MCLVSLWALAQIWLKPKECIFISSAKADASDMHNHGLKPVAIYQHAAKTLLTSAQSSAAISAGFIFANASLDKAGGCWRPAPASMPAGVCVPNCSGKLRLSSPMRAAAFCKSPCVPNCRSPFTRSNSNSGERAPALVNSPVICR